MYKRIEELAINAGKIMLSANNKENATDEKSSNADIVTKYDKEIQDYLFTELAKMFPHAKFLGEEGEHTDKNDDILKGMTFIIDPIDGTTNFVRDFGKSAVSIGLTIDGVAEYGCCYIPYSHELYTAQKDKGAYLWDKRINCADRTVEHAVVSVGTTPYNKEEMGEATFGIMREFFYNAMDIRRFGSAVIDLLDLASGRSDMFCELRLSPWDYAAAGLIAKEAGAIVTTMSGEELGYDKRYSLLAATPMLYDYFMNCENILKYKKYF